ncbi:MAG: ribonuclease H-like domain-containing protein [Planctomycetaceae bacterium]|nr:ribonuclease H-like domain-containing protein [Planctomycetaceae bacterium]
MNETDGTSRPRAQDVRQGLIKRLGRAAPAAPLFSPRPSQALADIRAAAGCRVDLVEATGAVEVQAPRGGATLLIENRLADMSGGWDRLCTAFKNSLADASWHGWNHLKGLGPVRPEDVLFLDLETTGLHSTPVFLIGVMVFEDDSLVVRQYFARDYSQERAILSLLADELPSRRLLVSFNGKSFDVPFVHTRAAATAVSCRLQMPHCDLLHTSRRIWGAALPNCRLQTLETYICRRGAREDDIDGSRIPEAYHAFVRTGNGAEMALCVKHNRLDLITLADILTRLPVARASRP